MVKKYIANSKKADLFEHSCMTGEIAAQLATKLGADPFIVELSRTAGHVHDIGKACPSFQKYIKNVIKKCSNEETVDFNGNFHNEVGARFLYEYADKFITDSTVTSVRDWKSMLIRLVFDHHPRTIDVVHYSDIAMDDNDIAEMCSFAETLYNVTVDSTRTLSDNDLRDRDIPTYVYEITDSRTGKVIPRQVTLNQGLLVARACLIAADRIASGANKYDEYVNGMLWPEVDITVPDFYKANQVRYNTQREIVQTVLESENTLSVVNAPAGIGKTFIGLAIALKTRKHTYWALPRNYPLEGVYHTLKKTCLDCNISNVAIEMVFGHKRHGAFIVDNVGNVVELADEVPAQITVTNIDAIVEPFGNSNSSRINMYKMMLDPIIFDEDHEFISKEPLYWGFQTLLEARTNLLHTSKVVLLSATPIGILNIDERKVNYLPGKWKHYPAQHSDKYVFRSTDKCDVADDMLTVNLSIDQVQKPTGDDVVYLHSGFLDDDYAHNRQLLLDTYGPKPTMFHKFPVSAGPVVQAAIDLDFANANIMFSGPNMCMQLIGRIGRHAHGIVHYVDVRNPWKLNDRSAQKYIEMQFDTKLSKLFYEFFETRIVGEHTLDEVYAMVDQFMQENESLLREWQQKFLVESICKLNKHLYPIRHYSYSNGKPVRDNSLRLVASGVTMRSSSPSIFTYVKMADSNKYVGPFNVPLDTASNKNWDHALTIDMYRYREWLKTFLPNYECDLEYLMGKLFPVRTSSYGAKKKNDKFFDTYVKASMLTYNSAGKSLSNIYRYASTPLLVPPENLVYDKRLGLIDLVKQKNNE